MRGGFWFRDPWRDFLCDCRLCDCRLAIAGADAGKTLTRKQTNIQYFDFFRFYMNDEFLTCIFVAERLFQQQKP
ncbi:hypothetical protein EHI48_32640 [Rhizobium sp. WSM1325]|nr:hypothetical protein EHI48_32640 [Rhizobium leguminosarum]